MHGAQAAITREQKPAAALNDPAGMGAHLRRQHQALVCVRERRQNTENHGRLIKPRPHVKQNWCTNWSRRATKKDLAGQGTFDTNEDRKNFSSLKRKCQIAEIRK